MLALRDFSRMAVFAVVVREGSFSAAARALNLSKSVVSEHVSHLEQSLGVRLLQRTTRRLTLTAEGEIFHHSCQRIVDESERAHEALGELRRRPRGTLRLTTTTDFGPRILIPLLARFSSRYPEIRVELVLDDAPMDLIEHRIDLAVRLGWPTDSSHVVRKLAEMPQRLVASPAYLERSGTPRSVADLSNHDWVTLSVLPSPTRWRFTSARGRRQTVSVRGKVATNTPEGARAFALAGAGITALLHYLVDDDIKAGRLTLLLPRYSLATATLYALYPSRRQLPRRVQRFVEFLIEELGATSTT